MALPAILSVGSKLLSGGSKLARTANVGRKLLGRKEKKKQETKVGDKEPSAIVVRPSTSLIPATINVSGSQSTTETQSNPETGKSTLEEDVEYIKNKTLEIDKLLKSSFAQQKKDAANLRKLRANARRRKTEDRFESGSGGRVGKAKEKVKKPFSNIFEGIKNYLTAIVLGFIAVKLVPLLPKLIEFAKFIAPVVEFITDFAGVILNGLVTFIDWGYKAYDATAGFIKKIGGEDAAKVFDKFSGAFTLFANLAIIAGLAAARAGDGPDFGKGKGRKTGIGKGRKGPTPISGRGKGRQRTTTSRAARKYFDRFGRDAAEKRFGKDAIKSLGGKYGRSGVTNAFRKGATAVADKIGGKAGIKVLSSLGKIGKFIKVPVIGGIISAVISLMSGESPGKAIFKGIGSVLGGALGSLIPVPVVGTILGGFIGDYVGDLLGTLFFGGGIGAAGAKLGKDILGIFTGVGKGAKAIFDWIFGGGLLTLLKNVGGGLLKFAGYILNPGGLLFDVLKGGAGAIKFIVGGLFNLIKTVGGASLKFVSYLLNPGGLLWDLLKMGGNIAKSIFNFAINAIGSSVQFIKDFIGGVFSRFIGNFPTIGIPEGWGIQTTLGKLLGWIPFLQPYMEDGRLTAFPDLSMFVPGLGLPFFIAHLGKSMFPGSFFDSMPSGLGDVWKGSKEVVENITEGVVNTVTNVSKGTQRVGRGIADALTFNVFDFDKQNEVEKKEEGGTVGLTQEEKEKKLKSDKIVPTVKSSELSISSVGATLRGSGNTGKKVKSLYKPAGVAALAQLGNKLREVPIVGEAMASAVRIALGIKPDSRAFNTIGANLINFASLDNIDGIASSPGELAQVATKMETGGEVDFLSDVESLDNSAKALNIGNFLKTELQRLDITAVGEEEEKKQEGIFDKLFGLFEPKKDPNKKDPNKKDDKTPGASPTTDLVPGAPGASGGATSSKFGTPEQKKLLDAIAFAEGTTGSYGTLYGGKVIPELAAGEMTIAEVLKMQKTKMYKGESVYGSGYDSNATGRYQFMSYVLEEEIGIQGIDPSEKFTPELQDRIILNRVARLRGVTAALLAEEGISDKVIDMLAPEFASFPNLIGPDAQGNVGTNTSYYGQGGKTAAEIKKAYGDSTGEASAISIAEPTTPLVPGVVPSFDTQTADPSSRDRGEGSKLAGELGRFLDSKGLGSWGSGTHQHPEHPPWPKESGHATNSLHYESQGARALDIGGWGPNLFKRKGQSGTDDQTQILGAISEFNASKGATPVELLHEGNEPSGHADHVHVAYQGGGLIQKNETDMSKSLRTKMSYDKRSTKVLIQPVITERTITKTKPIPMMSGSSSSGGGVNNTSDRLFAG
jgi:muramidase (phage lysozyme)